MVYRIWVSARAANFTVSGANFGRLVCSCDEVEPCLSLDKLWSELTARGMEKPSEGQGPQAVFQLQGMMKNIKY